MGVFVNTIDKSVTWHLDRILYVGAATFVLSFVWRFMISRKEQGKQEEEASTEEKVTLYSKLMTNPKFYYPLAGVLFGAALFFP